MGKINFEIKKIVRVFIAMLTVLVCVLGSTKEAYAKYDSTTSNGVAVIATYIEGGQYIIIADNSVVPLQELGYYDAVFGDGGKGVLSSGTGFFIGKKGANPQYICTNAHVVEDFMDAGEGAYNYNGDMMIYPEPMGSIDISGKAYNVYLVFSNIQLRVYYSEQEYNRLSVIDCGNKEKIDLAVLQIMDGATDKKKALPLMIPTDGMQGEMVFALGYPAISDNEFSNASKWKEKDITVTDGIIGRFDMSDNGVSRMEMTANINFGNSGGPLVTEKGYVVGINTNGLEDRYYAINVKHLVDMLNQNNIPYEIKKAGPNLTMIIIIAAIALAIIAAVVIIVIKSSKSKKNGETDAAKAPAAASVAEAPSAAPVKKASIRSMSSQHNGKSVSLDSGVVTIGRNPSCTIVYKEGTAGVSGKHAKVQYDEATGDFIITDVGSSYGTFLLDGTKLQVNVPFRIKGGDSFYVGDKGNILRVELN